MIRTRPTAPPDAGKLVHESSPEELEAAWVAVERLACQQRLRIQLKRVVDLPVAALGLGVTAPLVVAVALALAADLRESPFIKQQRAGHLGRPFALLKLKTMRTAVDSRGNLLPNEERTSRLGNLVRKLSIDELPQLLNVVLGDISLIGPRPMWQEYVSCYKLGELARLSLRPGITGLAQVSGRNSVDWTDRFALDVKYCNSTRPITDDIVIALRTLTQSIRIGQTSVNQSRNLIAVRSAQSFSPPIGYKPERCRAEWMAPCVRHLRRPRTRKTLRCLG